MDYRKLWKEENEAVMERYKLSSERIAEISEEDCLVTPWRDFFCRTAKFINMVNDVSNMCLDGTLSSMGFIEHKSLNYRLFEDILPQNYNKSYADPQYAVKMLGEYGEMLSFLYTEIRNEIIFAYEARLTDITICNELFIEAYNLFEQEPSVEKLKELLYWFVSDYCDYTCSYRIRETLDSELTFAKDIIMQSDLESASYLFKFGEYISEDEIRLAEYINSLPYTVIKKMSLSYTTGYKKGFEVTGRKLSKKHTVSIRYEIGFERVIKEAIKEFEAMGLDVIICRAPVYSSDKISNKKNGYHSASANRQFEYDHRYDCSIYMDKAYKERRLSILKQSYEKYREYAHDYAGPAVIETFGRDSFEPVNKNETLKLTEKQQKLILEYSKDSMQIINEYIPGDETSFTIIAFPVPEIGPDFEKIFEETIKINTLDYELYKTIQQTIIDTLDMAETVTISGSGDNETDIKVYLHRLLNSEKETNFENCVADVNIPLGEVFTSPVLSGTSGLVHVKSVYIGDICFKNLRISFDDGMVTDYSCDNFPSHEEGKKLIKQVILRNHDTLPMGEFAIGTNTEAYAMACRFGILKKLPILIVEKMGPHFAVGDTCYSWSEDSAVYNPDGKEIIARDNEISILRKEDLSKAYFGCHTDITIPYDEIDSICAIAKDGTLYPIIENGRFSLNGTEVLNKALTEE